MQRILGLGRQTLRDFGEDGGTRLAAALSYYTVFSLPPLLLLLVTLLGMVLDPQEVEKLVTGQAGAAFGPAADELRQVLEHAERPGGSRGVAGVLGVLGLLLGATGAFAELQSSLNRLWEVKPDPQQGGIRNFLGKRLLSFGMLLTIAFLLLVSLVLSTVLEAFGDGIGRMLPGALSGLVLRIITALVSLAVIALLFALLFKYVPDAEVSWADVRVGAVVTALLFTLGKFALGLYVGRSDPGSAYGAAGSLALLLVWIYYSAISLFLGAEFTQAWARMHGRHVRPEKGAVRVVEEHRTVPAPPRVPERHESAVQVVATQEVVDRAAGVSRAPREETSPGD